MKVLGITLLVLAGLMLAAAGWTADYRIGYVLPLGFNSVADINNQGQVLGSYNGTPCIWKSGQVTNIPVPGHQAAAYAMNDLGHVVGSFRETEGGSPHAFLWRQDHPTEAFLDLGTRAGIQSGIEAYGLNELDEVVGYYKHQEGYSAGFLWRENPPAGRSEVEDLGFLVSKVTEGRAINDTTVVCGWSSLERDVQRAFRWTETGRMQDLGAYGSEHASEGRAINNRGEVVGSSREDGLEAYSHAVIWRPGVGMTDMGHLPTGRESFGADINDAGQAVGVSTLNSGQRASFIWESGRLTQLPSLGCNDYALAINDLGWIAGTSEDNGVVRSVIWVPVPEPSSVLVLCSGLGSLLFLVRKRRSQV